MGEPAAVLEVADLHKHYETAAGPLPILEGVTFSLSAGEALCVLGPSGSGKSTLLYVLGALERPTSGRVTLAGEDPFAMDDDAQAAFRNRRVGFVFQDHGLLPQCSVLENVLVPTFVAPPGDHLARARALVEAVGLTPRAHHRPAELSGGEGQRAAVARALVLSPALVLCDEPTGNLDRRSAETVADLLVEVHRTHGAILVVATHSLELARRFEHRSELVEGRLVPVA